jgi:MFS family permease
MTMQQTRLKRMPMATTTPSGVVPGSHAKHAGTFSGGPMTPRQIRKALFGLLLGLFVAVLSSTIVSNALPRVVGDLGGGQRAATWVVTATLLAMAATIPLWGRLADRFPKKPLIQAALIVHILGSVAAGLAQQPGLLIAGRVVQGIGVGGVFALSQTVVTAMVAPQDRGRHSGYLGATFAVATVSGPLLGGLVTDTGRLGWRWCACAGVPLAVIALVVLHLTLRLPATRREVKVDWGGAFSLTAAVCMPLVWVTFAGDGYPWLSWQTYAMVGGSLLLALLFALVESRATEPMVPVRLLRDPAVALASGASFLVGVAMFAGSVFFGPYFELARGETPAVSGVLTLPMVGGLFVAATVSERIVTRTGRWKAWLVAGAVLLAAGAGQLVATRHDTPYWHTAVFMGLLGLGIGLTTQNLERAARSRVAPAEQGVADSTAGFFRSLGGAMGVATLGAIMNDHVTGYLRNGLRALGPTAAGAVPTGSPGSAPPDVNVLPPPVRTVVESAYGHGLGDVFLIVAPLAALCFLLVLSIREVPLRTEGALAPDAGNAENAGSAENTGARGTENAGEEAPSPTSDEPPLATLAGVPALAAGHEELPELPRRKRMPSGGGIAAAGDGTDGARRPAADRSAAVTASNDAEPDGDINVHGFVRGAEGRPVARAAVTLISPSGRQLGRTTTHVDGGYRLGVPGAGSYVLIASADGHQPQASTLAVGDEPVAFDVLLDGTSGLSGAVRQAETGQPVAGAVVIVTDSRGDVLATGSTGPQGDFGFPELGPGTVTVAVNAPGHRPVALPVEIGGTDVTHIEVPLGSGTGVSGVVRADGAPLNNARVTLVDATGTVVASATTGPDGEYAFADLADGEYTVIATGYPAVASGMRLSGPGVERHNVELAHPDG